MLDQKIPARPRVALVFADADAAGHLRDAVSNHVEIVYETSAADFDVSRVAGSQATAALVNLDDCDSLEGVEVRLQETGVAVVFNDPEISSQLDGWARARWLRHLTAKLSGNSDFDPPRPVVAETAPVVVEAAPEVQGPAGTESPLPDGVVDAPQLVERPLSPAEIESMTADFVALQEPQPPPDRLDEAANAIAPDADDGNVASPMPVDAALEPGIEIEAPMSATRVADMGDTAAVSNTENVPGNHDVLDIDTEALSAMIDARLAAAEGEPVPKSPEVWREVEGGNVSAIELPPIEPEAVAAAAAPAQSVPVDDADVLKAMPSLDDWQLVDPEAPVASAPVAKRDEQTSPALSIDFAGLALVPVETVATVELNSEPVERWMHVGDNKSGAGGKEKLATADSRGGHA
jgi:two-component system chemotaxis response regulator CheB/chemosensory pili system protein ChpB (putative protein-glutamate methylesterase)